MSLARVQEIGMVQMRIADGVNSQLQLTSLLARLCRVSKEAK